MPDSHSNSDFVAWFRQSSPYIHAHRGKVLVLSFAGEALASERFSSLIHDIALLSGLGMKLVLVPGARPQIEERLKLRNADMQIANGLRITDEVALECVKDAAGNVRVEIEALLSMGLANSPMAGARIRVASGNHVTARPIGVVDGIDYQHTGEVRRVDAQAIHAHLDKGSIVLIPPLGYSPTGEVFNINAADVASAVAMALGADKLIYLSEGDPLGRRSSAASSLVPREVDALIKRRRSMPEELVRILCNAAQACRTGVKRAHVLDRRREGVILRELFTRDGAGLLVTQEPYEQIRRAGIDDVGGILELIEPLEQSGALVKRSRELLEQEVGQFQVIERDGSIIACAALYPFAADKMGELACLAVHPEYRGGGRGDQLLERMELQARQAGLDTVFVLSTRTSHWFRERGFVPAGVDQLPGKRRDLYNWQRRSKVFVKLLS
jgi:amino-acid N-acetyltransferase